MQLLAHWAASFRCQVNKTKGMVSKRFDDLGPSGVLQQQKKRQQALLFDNY